MDVPQFYISACYAFHHIHKLLYEDLTRFPIEFYIPVNTEYSIGTWVFFGGGVIQILRTFVRFIWHNYSLVSGF